MTIIYIFTFFILNGYLSHLFAIENKKIGYNFAFWMNFYLPVIGGIIGMILCDNLSNEKKYSEFEIIFLRNTNVLILILKLFVVFLLLFIN
jgi:hypothetical protein